jgi:prepilin-type N-terminal cleavage/methylation domain-containing protein
MRRGVTLTELLIVVCVVGLLAGVGIVAVKTMEGSAGLSGSRVVLNAILASAAAQAESRQGYIGVRFQQTGGRQYAIFIEPIPDQYPDGHVPFRILQGRDTISLAKGIGIMPLAFWETETIPDPNCRVTILFSPAGRLTRKDLVVEEQTAMFGPDKDVYSSDIGFVVYNTKRYDFGLLRPVYVNAYTGQLIIESQ